MDLLTRYCQFESTVSNLMINYTQEAQFQRGYMLMLICLVNVVALVL